MGAARSHLGPGARFDDPAAPHSDLLAARRATADFARVLNALADADLTPARRKAIASVGYQARAIAHALEALASPGDPPFDMARAIARGATLPPRALRALIQHSAIHLNVTWRDLPADHWQARIYYMTEQVAVTATPGLRCKMMMAAKEELRRPLRQ